MSRVDSEWVKLLEKSQPSFFSDEIMFEILSRIPVKSIIRFKCVSKKWFELFGDSSFIAAHLKRSVEGLNYCNLVKDCYCAARSYLSDENFEELCEVPFEFEPFCHYEILASVDGLVCILKIHQLNRKSFVLLWNPATRESRTLPECPDYIRSANTVIGFGFDSKNNDYKVVTMVTSEESTRADVYSIRTNRWRSFEVEYFSPYHIGGAHVNGRLHWLSLRFMVSFNLTVEKIIKIGVPVDLNVGIPISLESSGKSLIALREDERESVIWLMKKYGDSKSWCKLCNIPPHPMYGYIMFTRCSFVKNRKVIMQCRENENVISYDPKNQVYQILRIKVGADIIKHNQSLVSVVGDGSFSNP